MVSLPVIILNSPAVSDPAQGGTNPSFGTAADIVGIILWAVGWLIETVADTQKVIASLLIIKTLVIYNFFSRTSIDIKLLIRHGTAQSM